MFMSEETTKINFTDAINILENTSNEAFVSEAYIPSLKRTLKIKEINAKQQKRMIESAIDSVVSKSTFSKIFFETVEENCLDDKNIINELTIADKISIAFTMRSQISETLKVTFNEDPKVESTIKLSDILEKFKTYEHPESETIVFEKNGVKIEIITQLPLFSSESKFDEIIYGKTKSDDQIEEIKKLVTSAFLGETAKYIKYVKVNDSDLDYNSLNINQKITFVENLPAALVQTILDKIVKFKEKLEDLYTVYNGENKKLIDIDSSLFLTN